MNIIVSGGWSYGNVGDEVIASVTFELIRRYFPCAEMKVLAYNPVEFAKHHSERAEKALHAAVEADKIDSFFKYEEVLNHPLQGEYLIYSERFHKNDIFIMSGGGYFIERWQTSFYAHLLEIELAKRKGAKVFIIAQSIGPVTTPEGQEAMRKAFSGCSYVSVRDRKSLNHLNEFIREPEIHLVADVVNVIADLMPVHKAGIKKVGIVATYAPDYLDQTKQKKRIWEYNSLCNRVVKKIQYITYRHRFLKVCRWISQKRGKKLSFIASTDYDWDHTFVKWITDRLIPGSYEIHQNMEKTELCRQITSVQYLFSTKMHPIIIASSYGIPGIALSYNYKLDDYMQSIGREKQCVKNLYFTATTIIDMLNKDMDDEQKIDITSLKSQVYAMFDEIVELSMS